MKYYAVTVQRGHCGCGRTAPITFYVQANSLLEAMDKARRMPGVKHNKPVYNACEVTKDFFTKATQESSYHRTNKLDIERKMCLMRMR